MKKLFLLCIFVSLVTLGCGGGSGGVSKVDGGNNNTGGKTIAISGLVTDPAIKNARVEVRRVQDDKVADFCGSLSNQNCNNVWSMSNGFFRIVVPKEIDFSDFYLLTFGGIDTETGVNFENVSLHSPLALFSSNSSNVIVSPVTSIVFEIMSNGSSAEDAVNITRTVLNLPVDVNPLGDPADSVELLKASYLLTQIAIQHTNLGGSETFSNLESALAGQALFDTNGSLNTVAINSLFENLSTPTERDKATQLLVATTDRITAINGDVGTILEEIIHTEKLAALQDALAEILVDFPSSGAVSAEYITNTNSMFNKLESLVGTFSSDRFVIAQMVKFVLFNNNFFADYGNYQDVNTFTATLEAIVPTDQMAVFVELLKFISNESVYAVNVPLGFPLGMDNQKRVDYYFKSNIDVNYKARTFISSVNNDIITDNIYTMVSTRYAIFGLHEKAEQLAKAYIISAEKRGEAYASIGRYVGYYSPTTADYYLDTAVSILKETYSKSPSSNALEQIRQAASHYNRVDPVKAEEIRNWLETAIMERDNNAVPTRFTLWGGLVSGQKELVAEHINNSDVNNAAKALDYYIYLIEKMEANPSVALANNKYNTHMQAYADAMNFSRKIYELNNNSAYKSKVLDLYTEVEKLRALTPAASTTWRTYYADMVGYLIWAGASDTLVDNLFELIKGTEAALAKGTMNAFIEKAFVNFDSAIAFYEEKFPLKDDFSNLYHAGYFYYMQAFTYNQQAIDTGVPGLGAAAYLKGDLVLAEKALDYFAEKVDGAVAYYTANKTDKVNDLVSLTNTTIGNRYFQGAFLRLAVCYDAIGKTSKAEATLAKAEAYTDSDFVNASFAQSKAFAAIGNIYSLIGNDSKASSLFDKARTLDVSIFKTEKDKADHYTGIASDYFFRKEANKNEKMDEYLSLARTHALAIYVSGAGTNTDATNEITTLRNIAVQYGNIPDPSKIDLVLSDAVNTANEIGLPATRTTQVNNIITTYSQLGLTDIAFTRANELFTNITEKNNAIKIIAEQVADPYSVRWSVAFSDIDKDGKVDFFVPWATADAIAESGLELDDDIDGDGKLDINDLTPFFAD
jgi:hypothetical protein